MNARSLEKVIHVDGGSNVLLQAVRLLPHPTRRAALSRDYAQMRPMFLAAPPDFDAVLATLEGAERAING